MNKNEQTLSIAEVDETIGNIEELYRRVVGKAAPAADASYAPIPAEREPAEYVEQQLDRLLEALGTWASPSRPAWAPPISISENDQEVVVEADLPGIGRDQVAVTIQGNALVIAGSRPAPRNNGAQLVQNERPLGPFRRVLMISGMRSAEPAAQMKDGILEIRIQKDLQAVRPRQVVVNHVN